MHCYTVILLMHCYTVNYSIPMLAAWPINSIHTTHTVNALLYCYTIHTIIFNRLYIMLMYCYTVILCIIYILYILSMHCYTVIRLMHCYTVTPAKRLLLRRIENSRPNLTYVAIVDSKIPTWAPLSPNQRCLHHIKLYNTNIARMVCTHCINSPI